MSVNPKENFKKIIDLYTLKVKNIKDSHYEFLDQYYDILRDAIVEYSHQFDTNEDKITVMSEAQGFLEEIINHIENKCHILSRIKDAREELETNAQSYETRIGSPDEFFIFAKQYLRFNESYYYFRDSILYAKKQLDKGKSDPSVL